MKKITISDFKKMCSEFKNVTFKFDNRNQKAFTESDMIPGFIISESFDKIIVTTAPDCVSLVNAYGCIRFDGVKEIRISDTYSDSKYIVDIVCKGYVGYKNDRIFTIVINVN